MILAIGRITQVREDGKIKVSIPDYLDESPWLYPVSNHKLKDLPNIGEDVVVILLDQTGVYLGSPYVVDESSPIDTLKYENGNLRITYDQNELTVEFGVSKIKVDMNRVVINSGTNTIEVSPSLVRITAPNISLEGTVSIRGSLNIS